MDGPQAVVVFRLLVRRDYQQRGRLALFSSLSVLLVSGLYISFPFLYNPSQWMLFWSPANSQPTGDCALPEPGPFTIACGVVVGLSVKTL